MRPRKHKKLGQGLDSDKLCSSEPSSQCCFGIINEQDEKACDRKKK